MVVDVPAGGATEMGVEGELLSVRHGAECCSRVAGSVVFRVRARGRRGWGRQRGRGEIDLFKPQENVQTRRRFPRRCEAKRGGALFHRCHLIHTLGLSLPM